MLPINSVRRHKSGYGKSNNYPLPYKSIDEILESQLLIDEDSGTKVLMDSLTSVIQRGYCTKDEFMKMCRWKSPRPLRHYQNNSPERVASISRIAFLQTDEAKKANILDTLCGVSIPVASAILTLTNPNKYGVIDIRVWQVLYSFGIVNYKPNGKGLNTRDWCLYLSKIRHWANQMKVDVRCVERTLFEYHKLVQIGTLY